jgi:hypothetical protein
MKMPKCEVTTLIKPGDTVRAYEAPYEDRRSYIEGVVMGIGIFPEVDKVRRYKIAVKKSIVKGRLLKSDLGIFFTYPPVNSKPGSKSGIVSNVVKLV